jgi:hypothetical protein
LRGPKLSTSMSACLREDKCQHKQASRKSHDRQKLKSETYILEHTRVFFTERPNIPCLGAARFEPTDSGAARSELVVSGAATLQPAASTAPTLSPSAQGLFLRLAQRPELDRGPRLRQGTREHPGLRHPG